MSFFFDFDLRFWGFGVVVNFCDFWPFVQVQIGPIAFGVDF